MSMLQELYRSDGKRLNVIIAGMPGSGKSFFIEHTLKDYLSKSRLKNERIVYITPKQETIMDLSKLVQLFCEPKADIFTSCR